MPVGLWRNEIVAISKGLFGRTWPESWLGNNPSWIRDGVFRFFPFHGGAGLGFLFPLGHAAVITATATLLWVVSAATESRLGSPRRCRCRWVGRGELSLRLGCHRGSLPWRRHWILAATLMLPENDRTVVCGRPNRVSGLFAPSVALILPCPSKLHCAPPARLPVTYFKATVFVLYNGIGRQIYEESSRIFRLSTTPMSSSRRSQRFCDNPRCRRDLGRRQCFNGWNPQPAVSSTCDRRTQPENRERAEGLRWG